MMHIFKYSVEEVLLLHAACSDAIVIAAKLDDGLLVERLNILLSEFGHALLCEHTNQEFSVAT